MADPETRQLGELITTDQQVTPDEQSVLDEWRKLVVKNDPLTPEELAKASELLSRWITVERRQGINIPEDVTANDISLFFPPAGLPGTNLDAESIREVFQLLASAQHEGQTTEDSRQAQKAIDPVMMFNGQFVHTAEDVKLPGAGIDFVFRRTYKNQTFFQGPLGINWDHNYNLYLRVEFGGVVVVRSSGELREDRYVLHQQQGYYVPPDGYHDILIDQSHFQDYVDDVLADCAAELRTGEFECSYILRTPQGTCFLYEQIPNVDVHRIVKIRDPQGNYLGFRYDENERLRQIEINHPERIVTFAYDDYSRIARMTAFGVSYPWRDRPFERAWTYFYDDFGDLICVSGPPTGAFPVGDRVPKVSGVPEGVFTYYEYSTSAFGEGDLGHNVLRIIDPGGQMFLENEYGDEAGLLSFNRVVRQRRGNGEFIIEYEDIVAEADWDYTPEEQIAHKTTLYDPDGHAIEHYYNASGKLLIKCESVREGCSFRSLVWRFRYNADGALLASLSPEGSVVQLYYSREDFYRRLVNPGDETLEGALDPTLTAAERIRFGNLLAEVRRATKVDFLTLVTQIPGEDGFKDFFPDVLQQHDPSDVIRKFTYAPEYQQILTVSDQRFTTSADPNAAEPLEFSNHLTRYEYQTRGSGLTRRQWNLLRRIRYPSASFPERLGRRRGISHVIDNFLEYDAHGRLLATQNAVGGLTYREYFPAGSTREGFLRREVRQQARWDLGTGMIDVAFMRWSGGWAVHHGYRVSDGMVGRNAELDFVGCRVTLYQDSKGKTLRGGGRAVVVELIDVLGRVSQLPHWNQTEMATYPVADLPSGAYTVRLSDVEGASIALGGADVFQQTEYEINEAGQVTATIDARGMRSEAIVNEWDQVIARRTPAPHSYWTFTSYTANKLAEKIYKELDPVVDGNTFQLSRYRFDELDQPVQISVGGEISETLVTRHSYDPSERRVLSVLPRGNTIRYRYDERGLPIEVIRAGCTPDESKVQLDYDGDSRQIAMVDPLGNRTAYAYDPLGRRILLEDALGNVKRTSYDKLNNVISEYFFERQDGGFVLLKKSAYEYDELGRERRRTAFLFSDPIDARQFDPARWTQDPDSPRDFPAFEGAVHQHLVSEVRTDSYRDARGRVFRVSRYGIVTDLAGRAARTAEQVTVQSYDHLDLRTWVRDALGNLTVTTFDPNANVTRRDVHEAVLNPHTDAVLYYEIFSSTTTYDELNRATSNVDSLGNQLTLRYDSRGDVIQRTDSLGNVCRWDYDVFGRLRQSIIESTPTGLGGAAPVEEITTQIKCDPNGNIVDVINPRGVVTHHMYDALDRIVQTWYDYPHDVSSQSWGYDPAGLVRIYRDNNGLERRYEYDRLNRLVQTRISTSEVADLRFLADDADDVEVIGYDGLGRIRFLANKYAASKIKYDSLDRPFEEILQHIPRVSGMPEPPLLTREYDAFSNVKEITYPGGRKVRYKCDPLARISRIENVAKGRSYPGDPAIPDQHEIVRLAYSGLRLSLVSRGNGTETRVSYDGVGRVVGLNNQGRNGDPILEIQQLHDGAGNKRRAIDVRSVRGRVRSASEEYSYDSLYRLTSYAPSRQAKVDLSLLKPARVILQPPQITGQTTIDRLIGNLAQHAPITYRYDAAGNRRESHDGQPALAYGSNALDQYGHVTGSSGLNLRPEYDRAGNTIAVGATTYHYNHRQQLTRVEDQSNLVARFGYDSRGRMLWAWYPSLNQQIWHVHDGDNVIAEYESDSSGVRCLAQYVCGRGPDSRFQITAGGQEWFYHKDGVGSTRLLSDRNGNATEYDYAPFGQLVRNQPATGRPYNTYLFAGRRYDEQIGAYDFRSRVYQPNWGRFLQRDPAGLDGANLYTGLANNPGSRVDPFGTNPRAHETATETGGPPDNSGALRRKIEFDPTYIKGNEEDIRETLKQALVEEYPSVPEEQRRVSEGSTLVPTDLRLAEAAVKVWALSEKTSSFIESEVGVTNSTQEHRNQVIYAVNTALLVGSQLFGGLGGGKFRSLSWARKEVITRLRKEGLPGGGSESILLRDAERYLWGRVGVPYFERGNYLLSIPASLTRSHAEQFEQFYQFLSLFRLLRTDWQNPMSPRGGSEWFRLGLLDYELRDRETLDTPERPTLLFEGPTAPLYLSPIYDPLTEEMFHLPRIR